MDKSLNSCKTPPVPLEQLLEQPLSPLDNTYVESIRMTGKRLMKAVLRGQQQGGSKGGQSE